MPHLVIPSDIPNAALLFDEAKTRQILKFFWPHLGVKIHESVRAQVASNFKNPAEGYVNGIEASLKSRTLPFHVMAGGFSSSYWS